MQTELVYLSEKEIAEQVKIADRYLNLIQEELSHGDLVDVDNVTAYTKAYKIASKNATNKYIEMPVFS